MKKLLTLLFLACLTLSAAGDTPNLLADATGKPGDVNNPYTVAQAQEVLAQLEPNVKTDVVYAKGKISKIDEVETVQYGNATFYISDTGSEEGQLGVHRCAFLEMSKFTAADQIKVGDEVIICGQLVNYRSSKAADTDPVTPEFTYGCYIYSLNGKTRPEGGDQPDPEPQLTKISVADALTAISALADGGKSENSFIVSGYVVGAPDFQRKADDTLYGNANFAIADEKGGATTLTVFRAKYFENADFDEETISTLKEGDFVEVQGLLQKYVKGDVTTPELVSGYLVSINGKDAASVKALKKFLVLWGQNGRPKVVYDLKEKPQVLMTANDLTVIKNGVETVYDKDDVIRFTYESLVPMTQPGDANGDGQISITDVTTSVSHVQGQSPRMFSEEAVDFNGDGIIDLTDILMITWLLLGVDTDTNYNHEGIINIIEDLFGDD